MRSIFISLLVFSLLTGCAKISDFKIGDEVTVKTERDAETTGKIKSIEAEWVVLESSDGGQIHQTWLKKAAIKSVKRAAAKPADGAK